MQAEKILRDALHQAPETGVAQSTSNGFDTVAEQAVEYAHCSVPDVIKRLNPSPDVQVDLAWAKIKKLLAK